MRCLILLAAAAPLFAQLASPNDAGVSLGHIHLMANDPDAQKKLWVDILGAEVTHAGTLELLKLPGIFVIVSKPRVPVSEGSEGSTVNHIGFTVKSYSDVKARLTAAGLTFASDNAETKQLIVNFPDKLRVEFTEDPSLKTPVAMHHIHLSAADQDQLRAWYVKNFSARAGTRGNFLAAFVPGGEVDFRKSQKPEAPTRGRSLDHIGFEVHNLEAFCKKLEAQGIAFDVPYREMPQLGGLKLAFIIDPEGTRIELTEGLSRL